MAKRGKGEGCIRKRIDGKWLVEFQTGVKADGKPKKIYKYCKTQAEAIKELNKLQSEFLVGVDKTNGNISVSDWCRVWLNKYKKKLAPTTQRSYETNIRVHIDKYVGGISINKLTTQQIQFMIDTIYNDGENSLSLVIKVYNILHGALSKALDLSMITKLPTRGVEFPEDNTKEKVILTKEQQRSFISALENEPSRALFLTYLYTGARLGELPPLVWEDVDLDNRVINICKKSVVLHDYDSETKKTHQEIQNFCKTKSSTRKIVITPFLVEILREHKKQQQENAEFLGIKWAETNLVFPTSNGTVPYGRNIQEKFLRIAEKAGIKGATLHSLRHTYATRLFEADVDIKVVSMQLGHKNVRITYDTYVHVLKDKQQQEIDKFAELDKLIM